MGSYSSSTILQREAVHIASLILETLQSGRGIQVWNQMWHDEVTLLLPMIVFRCVDQV